MSSRFCDCNGTRTQMAMMPVVVHEASEERHEKKQRNLLIIIIILIALLVGSNVGWLVYESQFKVVEESFEIDPKSENGSNNYIGDNGDIIYGNTIN